MSTIVAFFVTNDETFVPHSSYNVSFLPTLLHKLSNNEELINDLKEAYYCNKVPSDDEIYSDDYSEYDGTFYKKSCDIKIDEVNNDNFDEILNLELKIEYNSTREDQANNQELKIEYNSTMEPQANNSIPSTNERISMGTITVATPVKDAALTLQQLAEVHNIDTRHDLEKTHSHDS